MLPIRPKRADKSKAHTDAERQSAAESVQSVIECVLRELPCLWKDGIEVVCPDGKTRIGHPVIGAWLADYPEYIKLFTASYMSCPICIAPRTSLDMPPTDEVTYKTETAADIRRAVLEKQDLERKKKCCEKGSAALQDCLDRIQELDDYFMYHRVAQIDNLLFRFPHASPVNLWKPDLLHTMDLGLTKTCLELLFNLLDELSSTAKADYRGLTEMFDITWTAVSPHPVISVPKKKYRSVKQWSGKEYRNAQAILQAVLEAVLQVYPAPEKNESMQNSYRGALNFISALSNFYLMARQKSHTLPPDTVFDNAYRAQWTAEQDPDPNSSLSYMQHYLAKFHEWKKIFLKYRASKTLKKDASDAAKGKFPDLTEAEEKALTPKQLREKKAEITANRKAHKLSILERDAHYNMPKFHMLGHFSEVVHMFGSLPQYSTSINELLHQPLNNAYDRTNKVDAMDQTLRFAGWKDAMAIKVINLINQCKRNELPAEVVKDIKAWLGIFENRKARLEAARLNRGRMMPKSHASQRKETKCATAKEHWDRLKAKMVEYGISEDEDEDSDDSSDDEGVINEEIRHLTSVEPSKKESSAKDRQRDPGRLLRGRMLNIKTPEGELRGFMTIRDIEDNLRLEGLATALMDLLQNPAEKYWFGSFCRKDVDNLEASPYCGLRIRRYVFQSDTEMENHIIRCTAGENFRNRLPRADFVVYTPDQSKLKADEKWEHPIMGIRSIGQVRCFFRVRFEGRKGAKASYGRFAAIRPMVQDQNMTPEEVQRGMPTFTYSKKEMVVVRIGSIDRAACVVPVWCKKWLPPHSPQQLWHHADKVVFNTKVDLETFHNHY